jgi:peptide-O-fucosyltransferase
MRASVAALVFALPLAGASGVGAAHVDDRPGQRRLLYRVNPAEGFNLRRDAFLRAALLVRRLGPQWTLVLPPFLPTPHWRNADGGALPWSTFFAVERIAAVVPVVEWTAAMPGDAPVVDTAWVLESAPAPPSGGEMFAARDCAAVPDLAARYAHVSDGWVARGFGEPELRTAALSCWDVFAPFTRLARELPSAPGRTVFIDRFERLFWDPIEYDSADYWTVRRSMVFAARLRSEAARFRAATFGDEPYLAIHLRRGDFVASGRPFPSLDDVAAQARQARAANNLRRVFLATDATADEVERLQRTLPFDRWVPPAGERWADGEAAIVDQILAARAAHFIGSAGSTFTTVIMEERELAGQPPASTYNVLCPGTPAAAGGETFVCDQPQPRRVPPGG